MIFVSLNKKAVHNMEGGVSYSAFCSMRSNAVNVQGYGYNDAGAGNKDYG